MRDDELTFDLACTTSDIDLPIATPLKVRIVRRSPTAQRRWFCARNISSKSATARVRAAHRLCAHDGLFVAEKKDASDFPMARKAAEQAYAMAGIGLRDIDGAGRRNDCF